MYNCINYLYKYYYHTIIVIYLSLKIYKTRENFKNIIFTKCVLIPSDG